MKKSSLIADYPPEVLVCVSLVLAIFCGTGLLCWGVKTPTSLIDLCFTATSALCVTGFFTIPLTHLNILGQIIMMLLIQIGGLGLITLTLFFLYSFGRLNLSTHLIASKLLDVESWKDIRKIVSFLLSMTIIVELVGTFILLPFFLSQFSLKKSLFFALFHAISGFCNAGIFLFPLDAITSMQYQSFFFITITLLMFIGGLGFITWLELWDYSQNRLSRLNQFSLHTKLTVIGSLILIILIAALIGCIEYATLFKDGFENGFLASLFYGVSLRSSGFIAHPIENFHQASLLIMMIGGFIGSASFSTGSGIKITTLIVIILALKTIIKDKYEVSIFGRTIGYDQVYKAFTIVFLGISFVLAATLCLLIIEDKISFGSALFTTIMAYSNLGIFSQDLLLFSKYSKIIIIICMIIGRIGSLTLVLGLMTKKKRIIDFSYPEEKIMLG